MIVAFLRHGSTAWNEEGRMQGRRDVPLSDRGRAEVEAWRTGMSEASPIPKSAPWYSSPLRRAVETAEILSGAPPQCEPALIEMDWGDWEGFRLDELRAAPWRGVRAQRSEPAWISGHRAARARATCASASVRWLRGKRASRARVRGRGDAQGRVASRARRGHRLGHDGEAAAATCRAARFIGSKSTPRAASPCSNAMSSAGGDALPLAGAR